MVQLTLTTPIVGGLKAFDLQELAVLRGYDIGIKCIRPEQIHFRGDRGEIEDFVIRILKSELDWNVHDGVYELAHKPEIDWNLHHLMFGNYVLSRVITGRMDTEKEIIKRLKISPSAYP